MINTPTLSGKPGQLHPDPAVVTPVAEELDVIDRDLAALARLWGEGTVTRQEWEAAREGLAARGQVLRDRLGVLSIPAFDPVDLPDRWEAMGLAGRRAILAAVFSRIEVHRAKTRGYEPERIKLVWRAVTMEDTGGSENEGAVGDAPQRRDATGRGDQLGPPTRKVDVSDLGSTDEIPATQPPYPRTPPC